MMFRATVHRRSRSAGRRKPIVVGHQESDASRWTDFHRTSYISSSTEPDLSLSDSLEHFQQRQRVVKHVKRPSSALSATRRTNPGTSEFPLSLRGTSITKEMSQPRSKSSMAVLVSKFKKGEDVSPEDRRSAMWWKQDAGEKMEQQEAEEMYDDANIVGYNEKMTDSLDERTAELLERSAKALVFSYESDEIDMKDFSDVNKVESVIEETRKRIFGEESEVTPSEEDNIYFHYDNSALWAGSSPLRTMKNSLSPAYGSPVRVKSSYDPSVEVEIDEDAVKARVKQILEEKGIDDAVIQSLFQDNSSKENAEEQDYTTRVSDTGSTIEGVSRRIDFPSGPYHIEESVSESVINDEVGTTEIVTEKSSHVDISESNGVKEKESDDYSTEKSFDTVDKTTNGMALFPDSDNVPLDETDAVAENIESFSDGKLSSDNDSIPSLVISSEDTMEKIVSFPPSKENEHDTESDHPMNEESRSSNRLSDGREKGKPMSSPRTDTATFMVACDPLVKNVVNEFLDAPDAFQRLLEGYMALCVDKYGADDPIFQMLRQKAIQCEEELASLSPK